MDLGAYIQINELDQVAKANGISIPRLRGYRLMKDEKPMGREGFAQLFHDCEMEAIDDLCTSIPFWSANSSCRLLSQKTDRTRTYYVKYGVDEDGLRVPVGIRWDRIHGKKRRVLKYAIKKNKKRALAQYTLWNKYAGQENVLYIHSRMGGGNWNVYSEKESIAGQPWFLDRVDDWWDGTYCDFYARINPNA